MILALLQMLCLYYFGTVSQYETFHNETYQNGTAPIDNVYIERKGKVFQMKKKFSKDELSETVKEAIEQFKIDFLEITESYLDNISIHYIGKHLLPDGRVFHSFLRIFNSAEKYSRINFQISKINEKDLLEGEEIFVVDKFQDSGIVLDQNEFENLINFNLKTIQTLFGKN